MPTRCQAISKKTGKPCTVPALPGSRFCWCHDPAHDEDRRAAAAKGGRNKSNVIRARKALPAEPLTTAEVHAWLSLAFRQALVAKLDPAMLNALSNAAKTLTDLSRVLAFEDQIAELEAKIVRLERRPA